MPEQRARYRFSIIFFCVGIISAAARGGSPPGTPPVRGEDPGMLQVGEELVYSVHYSFFNIGKIRFVVSDKEERNGRAVYRAHAYMDSNPSLSWLVDMHVRFHGELDQDAYSYGWLSEDSSGKGVAYRKMVFDYDAKKMYYEWGNRSPAGKRKAEGYDTIAIKEHCQDGLCLFYFARAHAREKIKTTIPTFIDTNEVTTNINFNIERTNEDLDSVSYPVDVVKLEGHANFVGIFGLTGGFEGEFTNDAAAVPVTARMKVILGSIRVELESWTRNSWAPPKAPEN